MLHELSRGHRHRTVHAVAVLPRNENHTVIADGVAVTDVGTCAYERLEDGVVILDFSLAGIAPDADVHANAAISIAIDHPLCRDRDAIGPLNDIGRDAVAVVERFELLFI